MPCLTGPSAPWNGEKKPGTDERVYPGGSARHGQNLSIGCIGKTFGIVGAILVL